MPKYMFWPNLRFLGPLVKFLQPYLTEKSVFERWSDRTPIIAQGLHRREICKKSGSKHFFSKRKAKQKLLEIEF